MTHPPFPRIPCRHALSSEVLSLFQDAEGQNLPMQVVPCPAPTAAATGGASGSAPLPSGPVPGRRLIEEFLPD